MSRVSPLGKLLPHTKKKHEILRYYLDAFFPILAQAFPGTEILYVEGFAGPGFYTGDDEGSPVIALRSAYECERDLTARFAFVEKTKKSHALLIHEIDRFTDEEGIRSDIIIAEPLRGPSERQVRKIIEGLLSSRPRLGPAFFFLDQFGFTGVSMDLVKQILSHPQCETFIFLELSRFRATLNQEDRGESITAAFGDESWKPAQELSGIDCQKFLCKEYMRCLQEHGGASHVLDFTMKDHRDEIISCLFHCTTNDAGLKAMKGAMKRADPTGTRSFADKSAGMGMLIEIGETPDSVADRLQREMANQEFTFKELEAFVLKKTDLINARPPLRILEERGDLAVTGVDEKRKQGQYPWRLRHNMRLLVKPASS